MRVGAVADEVGTIHAGTFGNQEVGASLRRVEAGEQGEEKKGFDVVHKTNDFGAKVEKKQRFLCGETNFFVSLPCQTPTGAWQTY